MKVCIKSLTLNDIEEYLAIFSPTLQQIFNISSLEEEKDYITAQLAKTDSGTTHLYGIFETATQLLIGCIEIRAHTYRSQVYAWIHELFWGTGYFQEAFTLALQQYFETHPDQQGVTLFVDKNNIRSLRAFLKLGCQLTELQPDSDRHFIICGKKIDYF